MEGSYPKVLIIGQPFNKKTGGGVTMSNLFKGWPKSRVAVASNINLRDGLDTSVCNINYQLGYGQKLHPFPLGFILPKAKIGLLSNQEDKLIENGNNNFVGTARKYTFAYNLVRSVLHFFGLYNLLYKLKITPEFEEWISKFEPDIIYTQLASLELIRFTEKLRLLSKKPVAIHIMDDWPGTINQPGLFYNYWQKRIDVEFRQLMQNSKVLMSISDAMSEEYKKRYGHDFLPFHNPIDIGAWKPKTDKTYENGERFTILYAGRIGFGIGKSIAEVAAAVTEIALTDNKILFEIQTPDEEALNKLVTFNEYVKYSKPTAYSELPNRFASADILLLPQDFDEESIKYLKFSFPTKVSEYMISGSPILVYGHESTGITKYAIAGKWAYIVTQNSKKQLIDAINELYNNPNLRKQLGTLAQQIAEQRENDIEVREKFRKSLIVSA
jgi:glycosyltransferase involved in cell wall biosynthesis